MFLKNKTLSLLVFIEMHAICTFSNIDISMAVSVKRDLANHVKTMKENAY